MALQGKLEGWPGCLSSVPAGAQMCVPPRCIQGLGGGDPGWGECPQEKRRRLSPSSLPWEDLTERRCPGSAGTVTADLAAPERGGGAVIQAPSPWSPALVA